MKESGDLVALDGMLFCKLVGTSLQVGRVEGIGALAEFNCTTTIGRKL